MNSENPESTLPLLLEIGTEEIPARFLPGAISDLKDIAAKTFDECRIFYQEIKTYATPRRLVLMMNGISLMQKDITREVFGPSIKAAFDEQGQPTKAATGFAHSLGIKTSDLIIRTKGKGEYVAAIIEEKGAATTAVLPEAFKKIILSLRFAKSMRWSDSSLSFVRPIHWIVALFGFDTVHIEIDGIKSSNMTRGHRFLSPASFQIREIASYVKLLENNFVILDHQKRESIIRKGIIALAAKVNGQPLMDEDLLTTVNFLVEFPVPVLCSFSPDYLKLPKELLITVMKDHQKYFAIQGGEGNLLNSFIVISNTRAENAATVKAGAEKVIRARFDDAEFYFKEDRKRTLNERVEDLKQVTYHDQLGTLFEKTERISSIASFLAGRLTPSLKENRAARLSKTDLITGVVREFPELQGVMGKYYASYDGEAEAIPAALEEQYLPKYFGGKLPATDAGALLSLADKIDSIAAFFSIGLIPTGSEDPFALRRQAMGILSIIIDKGYAITLREIFEAALQNLPVKKDKEKVLENIIGFIEQRIEFILVSMDYAQDIVKSVLMLSSICPLRTVTGRIEALKRFKKETVFPDFLLAIKRVHNIIPKTPLPELREELLSQEEEKNLYASLAEVKDKMESLLAHERFLDGLRTLVKITAPVNNFFDAVLVMDRQEEIRSNRLSLLKNVWSTASLFADFSKLS